MDVGKLADGLWWWSCDGWRAAYVELPETIVLVDPVLPAEPDELDRFWRALDRDVARLGRPLVVLATGALSDDAVAVRRRYRHASVLAPGVSPEGVEGHELPDGRWAFRIPTYGAVVGPADADLQQISGARAADHVVRTGPGSVA